jgi:hypothetical protein
VLIVASLAVVAAIAVASVVLLTGTSTNATTAYRQKLTAALTPLVSANRQLSITLLALEGAHTSAAKTATSQAQTTLIATRGAVGILTAPAGSTQLSEQTQQALTQEAGYLQVVNNTLVDPTGGGASQLQTLASNTASALVPLQTVVPNAQTSISGADTVLRWSQQRSAVARHHQQQTTIQPVQPVQPAAVPPPVSTSTDCGGGLIAGPNTSCLFAENVQIAYDDAPGLYATVQAYSPVTGETYAMSCAPAGAGMTCSGANNASVSW